MYKLCNGLDTNNQVMLKSIKRIEDGAFIPIAPDNTDYQAYLKFLEEGGQPLPADEE